MMATIRTARPEVPVVKKRGIGLAKTTTAATAAVNRNCMAIMA